MWFLLVKDGKPVARVHQRRGVTCPCLAKRGGLATINYAVRDVHNHLWSCSSGTSAATKCLPFGSGRFIGWWANTTYGSAKNWNAKTNKSCYKKYVASFFLYFTTLNLVFTQPKVGFQSTQTKNQTHTKCLPECSFGWPEFNFGWPKFSFRWPNFSFRHPLHVEI